MEGSWNGVNHIPRLILSSLLHYVQRRRMRRGVRDRRRMTRAPPLVHEERNVIPFPPGSSIVSRSMASASSEGFARFMMGRARESNMRPRDPSPPPSFVPFSFRSFHSSFLLTQSTPTEGSEGAEGGGVEQETRVTGGSFTHYAPFGAEE